MSRVQHCLSECSRHCQWSQPMAGLIGWGQKGPRESTHPSLGVSATGWCVKTTNKYCNIWIGWLIDFFNAFFILDLCTELWEKCCLLYLDTVSSWGLVMCPAGCPSVHTPSAVIIWLCCLSAFAYHQEPRSEIGMLKKPGCCLTIWKEHVTVLHKAKTRLRAWVWGSEPLSGCWLLPGEWDLAFQGRTGKLPQGSGLHFQCWEMAAACALSSLLWQGLLLWI